ncbi:alpha/beta fold hydrolase [Segetibacter koreensis]|uniref:alpha/beta fold hydrolase n=1 Tax=Segetibacter koreensis TaxID=398037 RepID=UPI00037BB54B|nr:alpha/beta hydrolase [Segetibacter koreensis]
MEKKFQYLNTEMYYNVSGEGKAVVLLHGFAEDGNIWSEQVSFLQKYCKLIIPDLPGSGKSGMLQKDNVAIEGYATFINALLENENIEKCILLGHSMGGYITLAFAEMFAQKLTAFGFVHSTAFADNEEKKTSRQKGIKMMEEYGVFPFLKNTTPNLFSENYKKQHPERVSELIEQGKNFSKEALIQYYAAMMNRPDRTEVLKKSKVPVLFIIGSEDKAAPVDDVLKQVPLPKTSYVHIIRGVGHMSMWEEPEKLNKYLLEFIINA